MTTTTADSLLSEPSPHRSFDARALGFVLLIQAAGLVLTVDREGTPIGSWLFLELRWAEAASLVFERVMTVITVAAALFAVLTRSARIRIAAASIVSLTFLAIAIGEWRMGGAPFTDWAVPAHATRIAAPLIFACWDRRSAALWVLRIAIAITFAIHGVEAFLLHPQFIDFILIADQRIFGFGLQQSGAEVLLRVIGVQDIIIAALVLSGRRLTPVLAWAAAWGVTTAFSRMVLGGEGALHHSLIRAANGGLPLVLLLTSRKVMMDPHSVSRSAGRLARVALPAVLLLLPFAANAQSISGSNPGHLRVIWTEDPATKATISWSTTNAGSGHEVYFDTQARNGALASYAHKVAAAESGEYHTGGAYYHHARLTNLAPDTTYYFVVVSNGVASPERHFKSAHTDDREFRILSGGDSRSGVAERRQINQLMKKLTEEDPGILAFAHGGDYIDIASNWNEWDSWLEDHALTFTSTGRVLPIIPVRGNHEADGVMFNDVFADPGGPGVDYYVTKLGANLNMIVLDTNSSMGGNQATWLEQKLQETQAGRWIIPNYHRPAFPAVKTPSGARQFWVPLFEKYNVDVVAESDGHVLKRTLPIRNEKHDPTGIVYVGEGGLGVPQRAPISQWYLEPPGMATSAHHVQIFSVSPTKLVYEAKELDGTVADSYTFQPRRTGVVVKPAPQAPALTSVAARSSTQVAVTFNVDMDTATTANPAAYTITDGVQVTDVAAENARAFVLTTTALTADAQYSLSVSGVTSAEGAAQTSPMTAAFTAPAASGEPAPPTVVDPPPGLEEPAPGTGPGTGAPEQPEPQSPTASGCAAAGGTAALWGALGALALMARRRRSRA